MCRQNRVVSHSSGFLAPEPRVIPMAAAPPEAALRFRTLDQSAILKTLTGVGNANGRFQSGTAFQAKDYSKLWSMTQTDCTETVA